MSVFAAGPDLKDHRRDDGKYHYEKCHHMTGPDRKLIYIFDQKSPEDAPAHSCYAQISPGELDFKKQSSYRSSNFFYTVPGEISAGHKQGKNHHPEQKDLFLGEMCFSFNAYKTGGKKRKKHGGNCGTYCRRHF